MQPQGLDIATMLGIFKTIAEVMVTAVRGVQLPCAPTAVPAPAPPAPPVQVAAPADPLNMANFERMLANY